MNDPAATGDPLSSTLTDDAGKLRQYLMAGYNNTNPKTTFVLLGGDYSTPIPIRYGFAGNFPPEFNITWENNGARVPSDLYFSDFNTDWTYVSSVKTGTRYPDFSYGPEVFVGRLMCNSENDINTWTKKVFQYEKNPGNGDYSYLSKALVTEADEILTIDMYELEPFFSTITYWEELSSNTIGTSTEPHFPKGADVINELNKNYGFYNVANHGSPNSFATATYGLNGWENKDANIPHRYQVTTSDSYLVDANITRENGNGLDNLTNFNYPTILYSIACKTMPFDNIQASGTRNLGVSYTVAYNGGGPTYLGNTRDGFDGDSNFLETCFFRYLPSYPQIGIAEGMSKIGLLNIPFVIDDYSHMVALAHNLMGCPETPMWTTTPSLFNGSVSENGTNLTVNTGGVVADRICVMSALNDGYFEVQPNLSSFTFSNVSKPYYVTITKANYIPFTNVLTNVYVQNKQLYNNAYLNCQSVTAGYNVDAAQLDKGEVIIHNGANITFDATGDIILSDNFIVELGATFEAK